MIAISRVEHWPRRNVWYCFWQSATISGRITLSQYAAVEILANPHVKVRHENRDIYYFGIDKATSEARLAKPHINQKLTL